MYSYYSEIMLLTKSYYQDELECWLKWHLNILHFDHIIIFDNESTVDVRKIINQFPQEKIEYFYIKGWPDQFSLYNDYLKRSKAQWIIPLDDDEYLYIGGKYKHNIKEYISYLQREYSNHMYYILWTNLLSKGYLQSKGDLFLNTHIYYSYQLLNRLYYYWPQDNGWGKCLINNDYGYNYFYFKKGSTGHIPLCLDNHNNVVLVNGKPISQEHINYPSETMFFKDCFIAHYQYKTKNDWIQKCDSMRVNRKEESIANKKKIYDMLYSPKPSLLECSIVKELWGKYN